MNILFVGAHHDDIELGCAGTVIRLKKEGHKTYGIILTDSVVKDPNLKISRTFQTAEKENKNATKKIGLNMIKMKNPIRQGFLKYDTNMMRILEKIIHKYNIDTIFTHWLHDLNTDHAATAQISITAGRHVPRIVMYQSNWYQPDKPFNENLIIEITDFEKIKKSALECYQGEIKSRGKEWINSFQYQNHLAGFKIYHKKTNQPLSAETFEIIKWTI